ncbi:MAG: SAM-dependent methyltransferase, partial [Candidatus Omnitrophica bacterium]|nr:SAM-dependent methyltransferase [Candidatus Omnitrophota bacterium]
MTPDSASARTEFSSFRDPDGFLFRAEGVLYRQINTSYRENYEHLKNSGLLEKLQSQNLLVRHRETEISGQTANDAYRIIRPEVIPVISYPYEWCFSQIRDAALLTLQIQKTAMEYGMSLKDASAYNIQFADGRPVFIDTLSFEKSDHSRPWVAYRQFCQHFLAPLAIMHYLGSRLNTILKVFLDGMPLDIASAMLPPRSYLNPSVTLHIHLHSRMSEGSSASPGSHRSSVNSNALRGIFDSLEKSVKKL